MAKGTLAENFSKYFRIVYANSRDLRQVAYQIRHRVYCEELGWEPKSETGLETDECDPYSFTLLLEHTNSQTGEKTFAGTVRCVIPPPSEPQSKLPFELHCPDSLWSDVVDPTQLRRGAYGEVSRLAVPANFRRRKNEQNKPFVLDEEHSSSFTNEERSHFPNISIGLYLAMIALVELLNHSHIFVVVEPRLNKRLSKLGFHFQQAGDELDYHGTRALFVLSRQDFTCHFTEEMKDLYVCLKKQVSTQLLLYPYC